MENSFLGQPKLRIHHPEPSTKRTKINSPPTINIRTMSGNLNPNAVPFVPQCTLPSHILETTWPPISRTDDPEEHETLEGIKRLSKWITEWETSSNPRCEKENPKNLSLRKSFPIIEIHQPKKEIDSTTKQLRNSVEKAQAKRQQLEPTISELQSDH